MNLTVGRPPRPYDLLWPVARRKEKGAPGARVEEKREAGYGPPSKCIFSFAQRSNNNETYISYDAAFPYLPPKRTGAETFSNVEAYGRALLRPNEDESIEVDARRVVYEREDDGVDRSESHGRRHGCREAVEVLTRNPRKGVIEFFLPSLCRMNLALTAIDFLAVSYDIAKDGEQVAVLTFVKSAYRLGESILGVVDINGPPGRTRVVKVRHVSSPGPARRSVPIA